MVYDEIGKMFLTDSFKEVVGSSNDEKEGRSKVRYFNMSH